MRRYLHAITIFKHDLIRSGIIVFIGAGLVNFLNYIFTLIMGRLMTPSQFGAIASIFGLFAITVVPSGTITTLIAKYTGQLYGTNELAEAYAFIRTLQKQGWIFGFLGLLLFLVVLIPLSKFLRVPLGPLFIFSLLLPLSLVTAVYQGALQGLHKFTAFSIMNNIGALSKLILGVIFVLLGLSITGVMIALLIGSILSYLYGLVVTEASLARFRQRKQDIAIHFPHSIQSSYAVVVFTSTLLLALITNGDVVLAKHYFTAQLAGQYSALSVIGKILLYGSTAFVAVMLPMVSAKSHSDRKERESLFYLSLRSVILISLLGLALFAAIPDVLIRLLIGPNYVIITPYLFWYGLAMVCSAIATAFVTYLIATHNRAFVWPLILAAIAEGAGIATFHHTLLHLTFSVLCANTIMLIGLLYVYYGTWHTRTIKS